MKRRSRTIGVACAVGLLASGCYGPFNLTRQLHHWNEQVGDKYVNELLFVAFTILPVYGVAVVGDAVLFNSVEFWTGHNPVFLSWRAPSAPAPEEPRRSLPAG